jgi:hypothetical protein
VTLTDDDQDMPLFTETALAPGAVRTRCITLTYAGSKDAADVSLRVLASGPLAPWLIVQVASGTSCGGFRATGTGSSGSLEQLSAAGPLPIARATPDVPFAVQVITELRRDTPADAAGTAARADLVWSAG